jgi:hypothetical protein
MTTVHKQELDDMHKKQVYRKRRHAPAVCADTTGAEVAQRHGPVNELVLL